MPMIRPQGAMLNHLSTIQPAAQKATTVAKSAIPAA